MSLQIQQNRWEVMVDVADERGFGDTFKVEMVDDGYYTAVVRVVYAVGGRHVPFASREWCDAVAASCGVMRPEFPVKRQDYIGGDGAGW